MSRAAAQHKICFVYVVSSWRKACARANVYFQKKVLFWSHRSACGAFWMPMFGPSFLKILFHRSANGDFLGSQVWTLDFQSNRATSAAVPATLFGGPFSNLHFSKYCFRAIAVPAALWGAHFWTLTFQSTVFEPSQCLQRFLGPQS